MSGSLLGKRRGRGNWAKERGGREGAASQVLSLDGRRSVGSWDVCDPVVEGCGPCDDVGCLQMIVGVVPVKAVEVCLLVG